jgi:hypothetical protein
VQQPEHRSHQERVDGGLLQVHGEHPHLDKAYDDGWTHFAATSCLRPVAEGS